jgi:hypothetical protein
MKASVEYAALEELIVWIDQNTSALTLPADERSKLAIGCFDVALEHQAAIAILHSLELPGSALALLRVLAESLVRGLWLLECAKNIELERFKKGQVKKSFGDLVNEYETKIGTPLGVLSGFKDSAWDALNGFTHTGFIQVARRHSHGLVAANYPESELSKALGVAGALGLVAAGQLIAMSNRSDLLPSYMARMSSYAKSAI